MDSKLFIILISFVFLLGCVSQQEKSTGQQLQTTFVLTENIEDNSSENKTEEPVPTPMTPEITSLVVSTDKDVYSSREIISIHVMVSVVGDIPGVSITINGVKNTRGRDILSKSELLHLTGGNTTANFTLELPYCSSCSGMPRGAYHIYALATKENQTLAQANTTFNFSYS